MRLVLGVREAGIHFETAATARFAVAGKCSWQQFGIPSLAVERNNSQTKVQHGVSPQISSQHRGFTFLVFVCSCAAKNVDVGDVNRFVKLKPIIHSITQ